MEFDYTQLFHLRSTIVYGYWKRCLVIRINQSRAAFKVFI